MKHLVLLHLHRGYLNSSNTDNEVMACTATSAVVHHEAKTLLSSCLVVISLHVLTLFRHLLFCHVLFINRGFLACLFVCVCNTNTMHV